MSNQMILDRAIVPARFNLDPNDGATLALEQWLAARKSQGSPLEAGVRLEGDERIDALRPFLSELPYVALHLPKFTDGRVYSHARRLRELWKYEGISVW